MSTGSFNQMMASIQGQQDQFEAHIFPSWLQGRAAFGGLIAALGVEALLKSQEHPKPLRSIQVLFSHPVAEGTVQIRTQLLRQGKSVSSLRADISQQGQFCCSVTASFGASRNSAISVDAEPLPQLTPPESLQPFPFIAGVVPDFIQHFDMRWAKGNYPFTNCQQTTHGIWARFREQGPASLSHLIAMADIPPPIPLSMLSQPANGSSLTWSLEFLGDGFEANMEDWWHVETRLQQCSQGYAQQAYKIWAPNGQPVALGTQVMTVFS
ncbi:thioesterase family protein [Aestuariirhabdus sp. Z084]|uniref:acyl-CoA thioesterase n=1 Tax=Aestuariirhabdus haliotis TaxID=2918751 RepID=UPI00201B3DBD|nr:thioesterase family protein [Aestuariirhabdus haliotis]MCL6415080.1 thioesterase family protein [Aestuariirhabdus haliotis]MCL6419012.1 thioesterase family protein [Aestuariirhabdus haliotis]